MVDDKYAEVEQRKEDLTTKTSLMHEFEKTKGTKLPY